MKEYKNLDDIEFPEQYYEQTNKELLKREAVNWIRGALDYDEIPTDLILPPELELHAQSRLMENEDFKYGVRYGIYVWFMQFFNLKKEDLVGEEFDE